MRAIVLNDFGGVDQLVYSNISDPILKEDEVLIKTSAIGINPVDVKTRKGKGQAARLREDPPMILGWDVSGVIVDANGSTQYKKGDEVFGMINIPGHGKAYAEYVAASIHHIARKPSSVSHVHAAAASLAAMTSWQALTRQANVQSGQRVLIHAASGGVGHYAVQMAKHLGAYVIGSSSASNRDFVLSIGADEHVDYKAGQLEQQMSEVDVVIDAIGGSNIGKSLKVLKRGGTIVSLPSGVSETVSEEAAAQGKKGIFFLVKSNVEDMKSIANLLERNIIRSHIQQVFPFENIRDAHEQIESGRTVGKIVVSGEW